MKLPEPGCEYGYTQHQLDLIFGLSGTLSREKFSNWMAGQTMMLCEGRVYNHHTKEYTPTCGGVAHGSIVYTWDVERYVDRTYRAWD